MRKAGILTGVAMLVLAAAPAGADPGSGDVGYHPMMGWGGWFMGPFMMFLFVVILIGGLVLAGRLLGWPSVYGSATTEDRSLAILRERFARGEIDDQEFAARKKTLE